MRTIKLKYTDYYDGFDPREHVLVKLLEKHYKIEWSDDPDYLIYGVFGDENIRYNDCVKIFYTGEDLCPDFNLCDYGIGYEWMDYGDRYFRMPITYNTIYRDNCLRLERRSELIPEDAAHRKFCSFVYSNGDADSIREGFFDYLSSNYKQVDSGGRYRNNIGAPCEDKLKFQEQYKFSLAFENTSHPGYTTEKLTDSFAACTIPIYWGDPEIDKVYNKDSFIIIKSEDDFEKALRTIRGLDNDDKMYIDMLERDALSDKSYGYEARCSAAEAFLVNVIEQPKKLAYRRNRIYWGKMYQQKQEAYVKALDFKKKYINPVKGVLNKITGK